MPDHLSGSVGQGGHNASADVILVQNLLAKHGKKPGRADGRCGARTIAAIRAFQATFLRHPDGLVAVDGATWKRLISNQPGTGAGSATHLIPRPAHGSYNQGLVAVSTSQ